MFRRQPAEFFFSKKFVKWKQVKITCQPLSTYLILRHLLIMWGPLAFHHWIMTWGRPHPRRLHISISWPHFFSVKSQRSLLDFFHLTIFFSEIATFTSRLSSFHEFFHHQVAYVHYWLLSTFFMLKTISFRIRFFSWFWKIFYCTQK